MRILFQWLNLGARVDPSRDVRRRWIIPAALPAVLGREGAGIVEAIGDGVTRVKPDDSFVLSYGFCGACAN
ncbi:MAG: alcohol dehydrogenase catalytic domain-containing protein, partial [Burkholderiales bacterium]